MIRRLFEKLKLIKPRQPHLPQTNVSGSLHSAMNEIENAMERWHLARDNDDETLEEINRILVSIGRLGWLHILPSVSLCQCPVFVPQCKK